METEKQSPHIPPEATKGEGFVEFSQNEKPEVCEEPYGSADCARLFSQAEFSEIIKRATEIELAKSSIAEQERQFSFEDLAKTGKRLGLSQNVLQRAADELKLKRNVISLTGNFLEVKKRVIAWLIGQSPTGTKLETVSENEIILCFPPSPFGKGASLETKVSSLNVIFDRVEEGLTASWKADYSRMEKGISLSRNAGAGGFATALLAGLLHLLNIAAIGELFLPMFVWAIAFGIIIPFFARKGKTEADETIANMMSSAKELQQLEGNTSDSRNSAKK